jgi:hypothetical protein
MLRTLTLLVCLFAGCANIGKQRALENALAEFKRRGIAVQSRWQIKIDADVRIQEAGPQEVPVYAVDVYDPVESLQAPLYVIDIRRDTGAVDVFGKMDVREYNRRYHRSNQTMQPTAGR